MKILITRMFMKITERSNEKLKIKNGEIKCYNSIVNEDNEDNVWNNREMRMKIITKNQRAWI